MSTKTKPMPETTTTAADVEIAKYVKMLRAGYSNKAIDVGWNRDHGYFVAMPPNFRHGAFPAPGWDRWSVERSGTTKWSTPETRAIDEIAIGSTPPMEKLPVLPARLFDGSAARGTVENELSTQDGMPAVSALAWRDTRKAITSAFLEIIDAPAIAGHEPRIWIVGEPAENMHRTIPGDWGTT